jgi:hypothetical protein
MDEDLETLSRDQLLAEVRESLDRQRPDAPVHDKEFGE